ncbi:carboxypeptidase B-like [Neocloeon triangulifer]|uniref:carboxypeptidase B-like n=1 Tax=Neocloeon triangulifer TaxID=2078957 RepID=UPI00286F25EA|nr:carboxypeptidase B-like [Neocloeon triangulifer]
MKVQVALIAVLCSTAFSYKTYDGYHVLKTKPLAQEDVRKFDPILKDPTFDIWTSFRLGEPVEIMVPEANVTSLMGKLLRDGLEPTITIHDMGPIIAKERMEIKSMRKTEALNGKAPSFDRFLDIDEINAYLDSVVADYPALASIIEIGNSFEGRPLRVLKLSNGPGKSGLFMESVIHAREWIGPPVLLYAINELTENLANNQAVLDANDFYFLPVANPDGYSYTWTNERLWRKTRKPNPGSTCVGTDPNRNFDWAWGGGGPHDACEATFPGAAAFSEPEMQAYADFLTNNPSINMVISVHSYGQMLLYSWGDTTAPPPNVAILDSVATEAIAALTAVAGTTYDIGSISNVIYLAYGGTIDWVLGVLDKQAYAFELPGGGLAGFNPPPSLIVPVATETWEAIKVFAQNIPPL